MVVWKTWKWNRRIIKREWMYIIWITNLNLVPMFFKKKATSKLLCSNFQNNKKIRDYFSIIILFGITILFVWRATNHNLFQGTSSHRGEITRLQITCLHLVEALGSGFVVMRGNPAPEEPSQVMYSRAGNPARSQFAFLKPQHSAHILGSKGQPPQERHHTASVHTWSSIQT